MRPLLCRLALPTLVPWGADAPILPERTAHRVLGDLPHAVLHVTPGAGHAPMKDRPGAVLQVLVSFLQ